MRVVTRSSVVPGRPRWPWLIAAIVVGTAISGGRLERLVDGLEGDVPHGSLARAVAETAAAASDRPPQPPDAARRTADAFPRVAGSDPLDDLSVPGQEPIVDDITDTWDDPRTTDDAPSRSSDRPSTAVPDPPKPDLRSAEPRTEGSSTGTDSASTAPETTDRPSSLPDPATSSTTESAAVPPLPPPPPDGVVCAVLAVRGPTFPPNEAALTEEGSATVRRAIHRIRTGGCAPGETTGCATRIRVFGHTDPRAVVYPDGNLGLSRDRATSVAEVLERNGLEVDEVRGFGADRPSVVEGQDRRTVDESRSWSSAPLSTATEQRKESGARNSHLHRHQPIG